MVSSYSRGDYSELELEGLDADSLGAVTAPLYINGNKAVGMYMHSSSGSHDNHVITAEISSDGDNYFPTENSVTGIDYVEFETTSQWVRAKVTTTEGVESVCNIKLTSK